MIRLGKTGLTCAMFLGMGTGPVLAATPPSLDSASVLSPDLHVAERDLGDPTKYYLFHKAGVSFEDALADFTFCSRYNKHAMFKNIPARVDWLAPTQEFKPKYDDFAGGIVGGMVNGAIQRGVQSMRMSRCLIPRGYSIYRTSQSLWQSVVGKGGAESITVQARIASSLVPPTPRLEP